MSPIPKPLPLAPHLVQAACRLYATLTAWQRSDDALVAIRDGLPGFSPPVTLAKVAAVNSLYYTNVLAVVRVSEHFASVLSRFDLGTSGPELVHALANVPRGGAEKRNVLRLSLAAKFAHFFIDEERFPIYDKYALRMVARHAGARISRLDGNYTAFAAAFAGVAAGAQVDTQRRTLDRYLWIQGQYEEWAQRERGSSTDLEAAFKRGVWPLRTENQ